MLSNTTFNETSQLLSPWACWSRVGEFAHVSFGCRSTTASRTAETTRERGRDSSQQTTTGQTEKRRGRKRRRMRRKRSRAPGISTLLKFGSLREGEYGLVTAQHYARCKIKWHQGYWWHAVYIYNVKSVITNSVEGLRHILWYVVETVGLSTMLEGPRVGRLHQQSPSVEGLKPGNYLASFAPAEIHLHRPSQPLTWSDSKFILLHWH